MLMFSSIANAHHLKFLPEKSAEVLTHKIEKRGFVSVPLDYAQASSQKLKIFYRLIPVNGGSATDTGKPVIVVINGGPGMPSSGYRAYDYDYKKLPADKLSNLTKQFRVLIMDQRGTAGNSTALDMAAEDLDYVAIAKYFSADFIARDLEAVINDAGIGKNTPFYIISQSFGGLVGFQYMRQPEITRKPNGIIFSSAAQPFEDPVAFAQNRRSAQKVLNLQLQQHTPDIAKLVADLKQHFSDVQLNPDNVNTLWKGLGFGKDGEWQQTLVDQIKQMMKMDKAELEKFVHLSIGTPDMLNFVLSSSNMTPGWTDTTLSKKAMQDIPFEAWMLDECDMYVNAATGDSREARNMRRIDANPPAPTPFGTVEENKTAIHQSPVLFTFGDNDAMTPADTSMEHMFKYFYIPNKTNYVKLPGGHQAIFTEDGVKYLAEWIRNLN